MKTLTINTKGFQDTVSIIRDGANIKLWHTSDGKDHLVNTFDASTYDDQFIEEYALRYILDFYGEGIEILD